MSLKGFPVYSKAIKGKDYVLALLALFFCCLLLTSMVRANTIPSVDTITFSETSGGAALTDINLVEGSTKDLYVHGQVTEDDGCSQIQNGSVALTLYRSGASGGANCSIDPNNCYRQSSCSISGCVIGNEKTIGYECSVSLYHYAEPTDIGDYSAQDWVASVTVTDDGLAQDTTTTAAELNSLLAIDILNQVDYGQLDLGSTTPNDVVVDIQNLGNVMLDLDVSATAMNCDPGMLLPSAQHYSTSPGQPFDDMLAFASTSAVLDFNLPKQTGASVSTSSLYMKLRVPTSTVGGICNGTHDIVARLNS